MSDTPRRFIILSLALALSASLGWSQHRPTPTPTPIPENVVEQVERANEMFRQGLRSEAISLYRMALEQAPTYVEGHYRLGVALATSGRYVEAEAAFGNALRLDPNHTPSQNMLEKYQSEIAAAHNPTPTPTPTPVPAPPSQDTTETLPAAPSLPGLTDTEQVYADRLEMMPESAQQIVLWALRFGYLLAWLLCVVFALAFGAFWGLLFWLLGKSRGHTYPWCWMYGTFCSCFGFLLVFLPPKISHGIVGIMLLVSLVAAVLGWFQFSALDLEAIRQALEEGAAP